MGHDDAELSDLDTLFDACVSRLTEGEAVDLEALCRERPDDAERIRAALGPLVASASPMRSAPASGVVPFQTIGDFRIIRELGAGGMGIVYLAVQESLRRKVALKIVKPAFATSPTSKTRFQREAAAVAKLSHPSIVAVHTAGEHEGILYLAMDYVEGRGLDELVREADIRETRLLVTDSVRYAAQIARALHAAHLAGIVHRDVKPSNIRITSSGRAMLLDFGLARDREWSRLTMTGEFQGSPYYLAPEMIGGRGDADGRTDVYALGVALYECLTGHVPFEGETIEQVLHKIMSERPPAPRDSNSALSRDLETVVLKALEKDPALRYATAADLADDLEAVLAFRPIQAKPPPWLRRWLEGARRHPWITVPVLAATVLGVALAATALRERRLRERRADDFVATAREKLGAGDFDAAIEAVNSAIAEAPDHLGARATKSRVDVARKEAVRTAAVESLVAETREACVHHGELLARAKTLRTELAPLEAARAVRYISNEKSQRLDRGELELDGLISDLDRCESGATVASERALALAPERVELAQLLADLHLARFLAATEEGDTRRAAAARAQVERYDAEKRLAPELIGEGSLVVRSEPAGAEVHLFRFVDQATLSPTGERRLVPVALVVQKTARPYGAWVLVITADSDALHAGDLVVSVAGWPIRNTVLVSRAGAGVAVFDRLDSVDGHLVRDTFDAWYAERLGGTGPGSSHVYEFERAGTKARHRVSGTSLEALGIAVDSPAAIAARGGVRADVWSNGASSTIDLPAGLAIRVTGTPLYVSPATASGTTPTDARPLAPGSYLAVVRRDGCGDARVPFVVGRKENKELAVDLLPRGTTPSGFRAVAGGEFVAGPDWNAELPVRGARAIDPFFMMDREVTFRDYLEFLNDDATRAKLSSGELPATILPRVIDGLEERQLIERDQSGRFVVPAIRLDLPLNGVAYGDAMRYVAWRNERAAANSNLQFDLPTSTEWEFAARGADDRVLVCGDHFVANWLGSGLARPRAILEQVLSFPVDESPFGIYDLGGSVNEWCRPASTNLPASDAIVRGGAWDTPRSEAFRADYFSVLAQDTRSATIGFRLVARAK